MVLLSTILILLAIFGTLFFLFYRYFKRRVLREYRRAQKSESLKSVFLENVTRSLRSPMKAILGYSNMILEEQDGAIDAAQVKELASHVKEDSEQVLDFLDQLAHLAFFYGDLPAYTDVEVNLTELMASYKREAMTLTKPDVYVKTRTDLSPHCKATLDTNFMHQLMMHLLSEAAKYTSQGDIIVQYGRERKGLKVVISYPGNGNAELLNQDLYSFLQKEGLDLVKDSSALGLSMCKAITSSLGGELDIETENGRKTVATLWFPCRLRDCYKNIRI